MALTADVHIERYGTGDVLPNINQPLGGGVTVYRGSIALLAASTGAVKNASSPTSTDTCWGLIAGYGPGIADTGPGCTNASTVAAAVTVDIAVGTFFLASGSGSDQLAQSNVGSQVYVINETTVGLTSGGGTRPVAGVLAYIETAGLYQALGNYAIKMGSFPVASP